MLGRLDIRYDSRLGSEYVEAMWRMLQQKNSDDYVVAAGEEHSLQDFVAGTFRLLGLDWKHHMVFVPKLFCPSGIERSCGNSAKGQKKSCWKPQIRFAQVVFLVGTHAQRLDFKPLLGSL